MPDLIADAATLSDIGRRDRQEDAVMADFPRGAEFGLAVLSDGMGGHNDGDLASRIIVSEMFGELYFSGARVDALARHVPQVFRSALNVANKRLARHTKTGALSKDTGGTLVSIAMLKDTLSWISVGDSPLYLFRAGQLTRLNENHSLAPQIDLMVEQGLMDPDVARDHPQRSCLTSALTGQVINQIDCPDSAISLYPKDVVIVASDGLNVLSDNEITRLVRRNLRKGSHRIADVLKAAVLNKDKPEQDNLALVVITLSAAEPKTNPLSALAGRCVRQNAFRLMGQNREHLRT